MNPPSCPNCRQEMRPLQPSDAWPGWYICDDDHRWKLPLALAFAGMEPRLQPAPGARTKAFLASLGPPGPAVRRPSRSALSRPFWTR